MKKSEIGTMKSFFEIIGVVILYDVGRWMLNAL